MKKLLFIFALLIPLLAVGQVGFKHDLSSYPQTLTGHWLFDAGLSLNAGDTLYWEGRAGNTYSFCPAGGDSIVHVVGGNRVWTETLNKLLARKPLQIGANLTTADSATGYIILPPGTNLSPSIRFADSLSGIWLDAGKFTYKMGGSSIWQMSTTYMGSYASGYPTMMRETPSTTNPIFVTEGNRDCGLFVMATAGGDSAGITVGDKMGLLVEERTGQGYVNDVLAKAAGDLETVGKFRGSAVNSGSDSFDGLAVADTITLGASVGAGLTDDLIFAQYTGAVGDSIKVPFVNILSDTTFSVNRQADGDAGQTYNWWRVAR